MEALSTQALIRRIEANPLDLEAYCALAQAYESAREFRKAELTLRRAIEISPLHAAVWIKLGILYGNLSDWVNSADAFEQSCALEPGNPVSWVGYAMALIASQNIRRASAMCGTLMKRFPDRSESHLIAGHISKIHGEFACAEHFYRRAIEIDTRQTEALFNLVDLSPIGPADPLTERLEALRADSSLSSRQLANVCFSLARISERAGQIARAFALYEQANIAADEVMRELGSTYHPKRLEEETERIIHMFGAEAFAEPLESLDLEITPIFIVGLPRSGTTLVERILGNHPQVSAGGELPLMQHCLATLQAKRTSLGKRTEINLNDEQDRQLLLESREAYLDGLFERELDGEYITDKLPANFSALGLIRVLFPEARIVHCVREPLATCWSLYSAHFGTHLPYYTSFERLGHYYHKVYSRFMTHWNDVFGLHIIRVSYEKLVTEPETEICELLNRCQLTLDQACFNNHDPKRPIYTASMQQARQPIYDTSIYRWRAFEPYLGPLMDALGGTAR